MKQPITGQRGSRGIAAENRLKAFELYKCGKSLRTIAAEVGVCHTRIFQYVKEALEELRSEQKELITETRDLNLCRLNDLLQVLTPRALGGDYLAIDRILKIMERQSRLLGLDQPNKTEISGGLTLEQLVLGSMRSDPELNQPK